MGSIYSLNFKITAATDVPINVSGSPAFIFFRTFKIYVSRFLSMDHITKHLSNVNI